MATITGRKKELEILEKVKSSEKSEFVAIYGRRRVGKTFLIREAFQQDFAFYLTGVAHTTLNQNLYNFHRALQKHYPEEATNVPENWFIAFGQLEEALSKSKKEKKIIFLDELPWLDTAQSGFIQALDYFWNSYASARKDIVLIVCGSAASWMINTLIHNKGGLHNRITYRIRLEPFTLNECEEFFQNRRGVFNRYQLIQLYMVMGGVPFYLDYIDVGMSASQNINKLCFQRDGMLVEEFTDLYTSLFNKAEKHLTIIEALSKKTRGLTRIEIINTTNLPNGGSTTRILKELEESGFIRKYLSFGKKEKNSLYQLSDFYSLFYIKFIRGNHKTNEDAWINGLDTPQQRAWSGYAFEQVCMAHLSQIKQALGISGVQTNSSSWINTGEGKKKQIDLVIDRRDDVINICEMKFSITSFIIDKKYHEELLDKIETFKTATQTTKSIFLTMITTFGVTRNIYSNSIVQNSLTMDDLFKSS
ncbi:AAA family ATPase [Chitinophaga oryziterrae]|uniref:AAA family ATPase n=1 Tax=Chitinophaga oryziterrae TaxID=1031224 RepID=A0A6N8J963_9BACT|nr:ATP-binding protein [Chitinophaga oryziterrae]MVT41815.1 AAA family ATPase [Chitinophaga oryziterrae]